MTGTTFSDEAILNMRQCLALVSVSASALQRIEGSTPRRQIETLAHIKEVMGLAEELGEQVLDEMRLASS